MTIDIKADKISKADVEVKELTQRSMILWLKTDIPQGLVSISGEQESEFKR